jgi:hypothetical protein
MLLVTLAALAADNLQDMNWHSRGLDETPYLLAEAIGILGAAHNSQGVRKRHLCNTRLFTNASRYGSRSAHVVRVEVWMCLLVDGRIEQ